MFTIGNTYSICFPYGIKSEMTLNAIHDATENHQILYTFISSNNTKVIVTYGVFKRLIITEILTKPSYTYANYNYGNDNDFGPDDDLYC
jgi:hypothetical protein